MKPAEPAAQPERCALCGRDRLIHYWMPALDPAPDALFCSKYSGKRYTAPQPPARAADDPMAAWPLCAVCGKSPREERHAPDFGEGHDYVPDEYPRPADQTAPTDKVRSP